MSSFAFGFTPGGAALAFGLGVRVVAGKQMEHWMRRPGDGQRSSILRFVA